MTRSETERTREVEAAGLTRRRMRRVDAERDTAVAAVARDMVDMDKMARAGNTDCSG